MKWLRHLFGREDAEERRVDRNTNDPRSSQTEIPALSWIAAADNRWRVPVLDVRPITLGMLSASRDPECASNAASLRSDDGTGFIGVAPASPHTLRSRLRYPIDGMLADGVLFMPTEMEHKWAIYYHQGSIICVRSWLRQVQAVADVEQQGEEILITSIRGTITDDDEEPAFTIRAFDFLIRSHPLEMIVPAPLPAALQDDSRAAGLWCMSNFGNHVHIATPYEYQPAPITRPLRTHSMLHIAVARGDYDATGRLLAEGMPVDLLAQDGLAPLHWALARGDRAMVKFLLEHGSPVDVRSAEGATPLMNAVQSRNAENTLFLLDHGADPDAADYRGFTALHRAAEMGLVDIARILLDRGATPAPVAQGQTPLSLAQTRGEEEMMRILAERMEGS